MMNYINHLINEFFPRVDVFRTPARAHKFRESTEVARVDEQTEHPEQQDIELARPQQSAQAQRGACDPVRS